MTTATHAIRWISPDAMRALGWALLHFVWQGTAVTAIAAAAIAVCRRATVRHAVGVAALVLMLATPVATFIYYSHELSSGSGVGKTSPIAAVAWVADKGMSAANSLGPVSTRAPRADGFAWLVEGWLFGVVLLSLRTAGGFLLLERNRRRQSIPVNGELLEVCRELQRRLGLTRVIDFCECHWLSAPAVIGWFRPVIFLPVSALTGLSEEQLRLVIVHELAHIRRFDPFVNVFQVCVETLLFYHPGVWWLNRKIRSEREHCCDEVAVSVCGNAVEYARALTMMEEWRSAPALAMAANRGPLTERIVRVLGLKTLGSATRGIGISASVLCLTAALVAGNALVGIARPKAHAGFFAQTVPSALLTGEQAPTSKPAPSPKPSPAPPSQASEQTAGSYIDEMKAAGLPDLTVDQLIALKIQDVTPEYVRGLREQGLALDANKIIGMRVQGVTPQYVQELRAAGLNPTEDQIIGLKVQGADAAYYRELKEAGIAPDVDRLIGLKVQGVTPEYVRELKAAGLSVNADQVIALKVQDVTPGYLKQLHDQGLDPRTDDAIAMRVQDVTPEYVRGMQALGLKPSTQELIAMRVQDVTPEDVKALQAAGFKLTVNEIIGAKVQDVTPEFIEQARKHGFKDLTLQKLIQLRQLGILEPKADL